MIIVGRRGVTGVSAGSGDALAGIEVLIIACGEKQNEV